MTATKKPKKCVVLITYVIALVCLLLGLLLPFTNGSSLLATMLPSTLDNVFGLSLNAGTEFAYPYVVNFFGLFELDINSLWVLIYALITVVGIFLLIPIIICKKKKTAFVCASIVETIAVAVLTLYIVDLIAMYATDNLAAEAFAQIFPFDWHIICIAFVGTLVMLIIQTINYYHGDGCVKFIMWLLSALVVFCLFSVCSLTSTLAEASLLVKVNGVSVSGITIVNYFVTGTFGDSTVYYFNTLGVEANALGTIVSIVISIGIMLAILNHIIDIVCLGAKTTKGAPLFDFIRYLIEWALFLAAIILLFVLSAVMDCDIKPGIMLYVVMAASLLSMIISIARRADKRKKASKPKKKDTDAAEPVSIELVPAEPAPAAVAPASIMPTIATSPIYITFYPNYGAPAPAPVPGYPPAPYTVTSNPPAPPAPAAYPAPAPVAPAAPATTASVAAPAPAAPAAPLPDAYSGPTDAFIDKLTETEKLEFESIFIKKEKGDLGVPDYKIGCNNKAFFNAVFLHLATFRIMLSDGLLGKIYDETN